MNVEQVMTREVKTCSPDDSLSRAAQIMWETDCGAVPVVDAEGKPVAMITDRDICMAAYTRGLALSEMTVSSACSKRLVTVGLADMLATAEQLMRQFQIRRLPVVNGGARVEGRVVGILSMNDLARRALARDRRGEVGAEGVVKTLAAICTPAGRA